jgi:hypothetical protein
LSFCALVMQGADFKTWLDDVVAKQEALPAHEEPAFTVEQLQDRFEPVSRMFARLNAVPAPKPPPPPPSPPPADGPAHAEASAEAEEAEGDPADTDKAEDAAQEEARDELR